MKLYELSNLYADLLRQIEDGDLDQEQMLDALNVIEDEFDVKVENTVKFIKSLEGSIGVVKAEEKRLKEQRQSLEKKVDKLKTYILENMKMAKIDRIKSDLFNISLRNNPGKVDIYNEEEFIKIARDHFPDLIEEVTEIKIDKARIKELLKDENLMIPGVKINKEKGLSIK